MLNKVAGYGISFYLCPTEKRNTFSSAEAPLERQKHKLLHKIRTKKKL